MIKARNRWIPKISKSISFILYVFILKNSFDFIRDSELSSIKRLKNKKFDELFSFILLDGIKQEQKEVVVMEMAKWSLDLRIRTQMMEMILFGSPIVLFVSHHCRWDNLLQRKLNSLTRIAAMMDRMT